MRNTLITNLVGKGGQPRNIPFVAMEDQTQKNSSSSSSAVTGDQETSRKNSEFSSVSAEKEKEKDEKIKIAPAQMPPPVTFTPAAGHPADSGSGDPATSGVPGEGIKPAVAATEQLKCKFLFLFVNANLKLSAILRL